MSDRNLESEATIDEGQPQRRATDVGAPTMAQALLLVHQGIIDSNQATRDLTEQMRHEAAQILEQTKQAQRRRTLFTVLGFGLVVALLALIVWVGFGNRDNVTETRKTTEAVQDCTLPTGQCFKDNQQRLGQSIAQIVQQVSDANEAETTEIVRRVCIIEGGTPDQCASIAESSSTPTTSQP